MPLATWAQQHDATDRHPDGDIRIARDRVSAVLLMPYRCIRMMRDTEVETDRMEP
ncbi:hypothetical protein JCM10599A_66890 [Paraburkholderia kururiensis]